MPIRSATLCDRCNLRRVKIGCFIRKSDGRSIQRFRCKLCKRSTSLAVNSPCYRQKKRQLNPVILKLYCSSVSLRRIAFLLGISRLTVDRKFVFLAKQAGLKNQKLLQDAISSPVVKTVFLDEMEDRVHTKCKPAAIALAVTEARMILGHSVSPIRPKNLKLNAISKAKYPQWNDTSREGFKCLLEKLRPYLSKTVKVISDQKLFYNRLVKEQFPESEHIQYESRRAVVAGLGELKEGGFDPMFPLNHTCAMLRANISRLVRRTWCTSKLIERLNLHISLYAYFHNSQLIKP